MKKQLIILLSALLFAGCPVNAADKEKDNVVGIGVAIEVKGFSENDKAENMVVSKEHPVVIKELIPGGPAIKAGLKTGDRILEIDGKSVEGLLFADVVAKIRGKDNTKVKVTFESVDNKEPKTVSIERKQITN